jgi:superfamily II DNA/RNA helicase
LTVNQTPRELDTEELELSSRTSSEELSAKLDELGRRLPDAPVDIVLTTSMFGTGVDVPRLGLMFVAGQPKTTSSYIQATGRVGRTNGGLVVTFLRASRPRDLNHYEYFVGYHDAIYRYVEPITVNPFAERARDHGIGPVAVALLRNASAFVVESDSCPVELPWRIQERRDGRPYSEAKLMAQHRSDAEVEFLSRIFDTRASAQPESRRPSPGEVSQHLAAELDRWYQLAQLHPVLLYSESTQNKPAEFPVVLGDLAHEAANYDVAYENAPNSLREVEATTTFRGRV